MPRFEPFAGLRYDSATAPIADVVAPPYDVVSPTDREELAARSPYNAIHVELPTSDDGTGDRYAAAARRLEAWTKAGAVRRDPTAAYYVYRMTFTTEDGRERSTTGAIGALGIDVVGGSDVLPHERTTPKPKGDRLDLLRACRANLSPIWGLSLSEGLAAACTAATASTAPSLSATDDEGVRHDLWCVTDPTMLEQIGQLVAATPVVIADGHHRYETALFYRNERRASNHDQPGPYDLVMAFVVELSEPELFVQAIHRLVSGLPDELDILQSLAPYFAIGDGPQDPSELQRAMEQEGAIGLVTPRGNHLLVPSTAVEQAAEAELDSSRLDVALASLPAHELVYQHGTRLASQAVTTGAAQLAFLLRPATVAQIADTAHSGRRMPPKTTFFHPKPRTGMVFRSVDS